LIETLTFFKLRSYRICLEFYIGLWWRVHVCRNMWSNVES
jgi:hypothetical protein